MKENIEKIFIQDSREKKRIGIGIHNRASRRGYIRGGIKTQSDFLSAREKKKLNGEVIVKNMYDDINRVPSIEDIKAMDYNKAKQLIAYCREKHKANTLLQHWGCTKFKMYTFFNNYKDYDTPEKGDQLELDLSLDLNYDNTVKNLNNDINCEDLQKAIDRFKSLQKTLEDDGNRELNKFKINDNNTYTHNQITNRLKGISMLMSDNKKYKINLIIEEV